MAKGKLSIHRVHSDEDYIAIEITDALSGTKFLQVELTAEVLGLVLTGLSFQECKFNLHRVDLVGKKREHKSELVPRPKKYRDDKKAAEEADGLLAPFEIDGWKAHRYDLYNHHNWVKDDMVQVGFIRFVEATSCEETCPSGS